MRKIAVGLLIAIVALAVFAPVVAPFNPTQQLDIVALKNAAPSASHLLGTDAYSRDVLSRASYGARASLFVAFIATLIATVFGVLWGGVAASAHWRYGEAMMTAVDVFRSVPRMLVFLVVAALAGALSPVALGVLLGVAGWPAMSRLAFAQTREIRARSFVEAARANGSSGTRVLFQHIVPHLAGPLSAACALLLADVLALESGLSFLGIGIRPPGASWGNMLQDALPYLGTAWWTAAVPCTLLLMTVLSASAIAEILQKNSESDETGVPGL